MLFKMTSGLDMLQLFQPGVAIMAQQMLGNETLMQVRGGGGQEGLERRGYGVVSVGLGERGRGGPRGSQKPTEGLKGRGWKGGEGGGGERVGCGGEAKERVTVSQGMMGKGCNGIVGRGRE